MNKLKGLIVKITTQDDLSLVELKVDNNLFTSIIIASSEMDFLDVNKEVFILFKETEVSIAKNLLGGLSIRNRMHSSIKDILKGAILSKIRLDYKGKEIISIITTQSANILQLEVGDIVEALVKTNEITLMKV